VTDYQTKRNAALRDMAERAIGAYNEECMEGGEPEYPLWATHMIEVLNEVETLPDRVLH
jgi:hypothetical protein